MSGSGGGKTTARRSPSVPETGSQPVSGTEGPESVAGKPLKGKGAARTGLSTIPAIHPTLGLPITTAAQIKDAKERLGIVVPPMSYGLTFLTGKTAVAQFTDLAGRRINLYPPGHREKSLSNKFGPTLQRFEQALPRIREQAHRDLSRIDGSIQNAMAAVVTIIDRTNMRIGGEANTTGKFADPSYGASSLRKQHVQVSGNKVLFRFTGKDQVPWERVVDDLALARTVQTFAETTKGERLWPVREDDVRDYLRPFGVTPHIWRTHTACRTVAATLAELGAPTSLKQAKANIKVALRKAADLLGHTNPNTTMKSYVDPRILECYLQGLVTPETVGKKE